MPGTILGAFLFAVSSAHNCVSRRSDCMTALAIEGLEWWRCWWWWWW